jgi:precorrin-2/cobalt-factor-2 C20-methyltransferase
MKTSTPSGKLYGIGIGPGDPELISLKGHRLLQQVPVVAFPAGVNGKPGLAQQIVQPWLSPNQQQLALSFPYVQDAEVLQTAWQVAAQQVGALLHQGDDVAFVSEGDISFYSTFSYLAQTLQALEPGVQIEWVPGICSPLAAAAALGMPLTQSSDRLVILPALYNADELPGILDWADVVVLMKVSSVYPQIWPVLQARGLLQRSYVVERATTPAEIIYRNLEAHPELELPYFSLLVIYVRPTTHAPEKS